MLLKRKYMNLQTERLTARLTKAFRAVLAVMRRGRTDTACLRLRLPGGRLTKERLGFIAECAEKYSVPRMKLTTCQTIQMHDLPPQSVVEIMKRALDYDIITRGGGGDFPRNVMVSPLTGVEQGEYFDVMPTAQAVNDYLLAQVREIRLPRKLRGRVLQWTGE